MAVPTLANARINLDPANGTYLGVLDATTDTVPQGARAPHNQAELDYVIVERPGAIRYDGAAWVVASLPPVPPSVQLLGQLFSTAKRKVAAGVWFKAASQAQPVLFATDEPGSRTAAVISAARDMAKEGVWGATDPLFARDGTPIPMTGAEVETLAVQESLYVRACIMLEAQLASQIAQGQTPDVTQGWPSQGTPPSGG